MLIQKNAVVTMHYTLKDDEGGLIQSSLNAEPLAYLHGAGNIIKGLESALEGKQAGAKVQVSIEPGEAYGERDDRRVQDVPKSMFPEPDEVEVGNQFHAADPQGNPVVVTVIEVGDDSVTVDGNHPLAGIRLHFDVEVVDVRDATMEELAHGHVHGPGGHHH